MQESTAVSAGTLEFGFNPNGLTLQATVQDPRFTGDAANLRNGRLRVIDFVPEPSAGTRVSCITEPFSGPVEWLRDLRDSRQSLTVHAGLYLPEASRFWNGTQGLLFLPGSDVVLTRGFGKDKEEVVGILAISSCLIPGLGGRVIKRCVNLWFFPLDIMVRGGVPVPVQC